MATEHTALSESRQLLLVLAPEWKSTSAQLYQYERSHSGLDWRLVHTLPAALGQNGLAWGKGLHGGNLSAASSVHEGDGKSPAGIFALGPAVGNAPAGERSVEGFPYHQVTAETLCIKDPWSLHYNQIVERTAILHPDWGAAEPLLRPDDLYRYGVFVQHNPQPGKQEPALGSGIFLHASAGAAPATSGGTALAPEKMAGVQQWLREAAQPRLVQLPRAEYQRLRAEWGLPSVPEPPPLTFAVFGILAVVMLVGAWLYAQRRQRPVA